MATRDNQEEPKRRAPEDGNGRFRPAIVILLLASALAAFGLPFRADTPPEPPAGSPQVGGPRPAVPYPEAARIDIEEAHARFAAHAAVFVDVRARAEYDADHIPGAMSLPVAEVEARHRELAGFSEILTYCTWANEESSARAALKLKELGFQDVKAIRGGFNAWRAAGHETVAESR